MDLTHRPLLLALVTVVAMAGCLGEAASGDDADSATTREAGAATTPERWTYADAFDMDVAGTQVRACTPAAEPGVGADTKWQWVSTQRLVNASDLQVTVTWTPVNPTADTLTVAVAANVEASPVAEVTGTSPLQVVVPADVLATLGPWAKVAVVLPTTCATQAPAQVVGAPEPAEMQQTVTTVLDYATEAPPSAGVGQ